MKSADASGKDEGGENESNIECPEHEIHRLRQELQRLKQKFLEINDTQAAEGSIFSNIQSTGFPPEKSGYLFKWQDRTIGWSGTKWGLRFVRLECGQISYYRSHEEVSPRYILTLKNCAVRDEGSKVNKRRSGDIVLKSGTGSATGSHFHVFSIYQQSAEANNLNAGGNDEDEIQNDINIVPLLRFSTQSLAEKAQWIDLISQHCAFCDSNEFRDIQAKLGSRNQQRKMPEKGTLPALYFEPPRILTSVPSGYKLDEMSKRHRSRSNVKDSARSNNISYPPSKPMHRQSNPSYLSEGAHKQNYRGLFNLLVIILVVSNFRLILDAVSKHGFILNKIGTLSDFWEAEWSEKMVDFPFLSGLLIVQVFVIGSYAIEKMLCQAWIGECFGMLLHLINTNASLGVVSLVVWHLVKNPLKGAALILQATITWLKLISYVHANHDYRATVKETHKAMFALVKDLDDEGLQMTYPQNVTLGNIYFFWFAPTLTYQIAFPRTPYIRWDKVLTLTIRLFISAALVAFFAAQVIAPNLDNLMRDLEANKGQPISHIDVIGSYLLKLSLTSTYIWLLTFYGFFHCFLNISAELLRFGDRVFYRDWWNASEVSAYWRLWNMPVHYWLVRHVYFPSIRIGLSKKSATFVVFFVSAVMHEVLISVPCHMVRAWSFLAMMGQLPLIILTKYIDKRNPGSSIGNIIFWISFCFVGQPMAILLYTIDYWEINHQNRLDDIILDDATKAPPQRGYPLAMIGRVFGASPEL